MAGNSARTKQVIIMRKDLELSVGKLCAQAAHASLSAILEKNKSHDKSSIHIDIPQDESEWFHERFTKIVLYVKNEQELLDLHSQAKEAGLNVSRPIIDAGFTELSQPTLTCIAIGPNLKEDIDKITSKLRTFTQTSKQEKATKYLKKRLQQLEKTGENKDEIGQIKTILES